MSSALSLTFQHLTKTKNLAAVDVLTAGLDSPHPLTRDWALRAILARPDVVGHQEVFQRLKTLDSSAREVVGQRADRLARVAGDAMRSPNPAMCSAACDAILSYRLYEALPALVAVLEPDHPNLVPAAQTILKLTELFYGELCAPVDDKAPRRDMDGLRRRITSALETGVSKFRFHRRAEVVEAFLLVAKQQNVILRQVLQHTNDANHKALVEILSNSSQGGVVRLLLSFLEDSQFPQVIKNILASRTDLKFVKNFLQAVRSMTPRTAQESLGRIDRLEWASPEHPTLAKLDDEGQRDVVRMLMATAIPRAQVLKVLAYLLMEGTQEGSRAAAETLAEFHGPEADALMIKALNNRDPVVRAHLIRQLRPREIPGAMSLLMRMVDHPSAEVREALRDSLPEFTIRHFLINFDTLPEELVATTGNMVRRIDIESVPTLQREMLCLSPVRRRRAVQAANAMGLVRELEQTIIGLLSDDDHMVRIEVARALATCDTAPTWEALRDALLDRSVIVQEAAEQSLEQITRSLARETGQEQSSEMDTQEVLR